MTSTLGDNVQTRLTVVLFSDIVGSTQLKSRIGDVDYFKMLDRHNELFASGVSELNGAKCIKHTGDGYLSEFRTASDAVKFALKFQSRMRLEPWGQWRLESRVGIHQGEVIDTKHAGQCDLIGAAVDTAARVMSLGLGSQILLTQQVFNDARQHLIGARRERDAPPLTWLQHGPYQFKGIDDPLVVCEVGITGISPLTHPPNNPKAHRVLPRDQESAQAESGWRPAVSLEIPGRSGWVLKRKLGDGGFGEVWLAAHNFLGEERVFKFCFDGNRLRSFKREVTLVRLMNKTLGDRPDIARLHDLKVDEPPFFIESDYVQGGDLLALDERSGGIATLPLADRLELIAKVADTVAAAHSVGVLHKDIKPANILIRQQPGGVIQPILSDFGIGQLADPSQMQMLSTAAFSLTQLNITGGDNHSAGTQMYSPPEALLNKPFTTHGDVYALGVLLYQVVVGDLHRPLAVGWERQIDDELLRKDIADMVEGDPQLRIATASEVAERIRTLDERRLALTRERDAARRSRQRSTRMKIIAALAVVLSALASLSLFGWIHERHLRDRADQQSQRINELVQTMTSSLLDVCQSLDSSPRIGKLRPPLSGAVATIDNLLATCEKTLGFNNAASIRLRITSNLGKLTEHRAETLKIYQADLATLTAQWPNKMTDDQITLGLLVAAAQSEDDPNQAAATLDALLGKMKRLNYGVTVGTREQSSLLAVRSERALIYRDQKQFDNAIELAEQVAGDVLRDFDGDDPAMRTVLTRLGQIHESAGTTMSRSDLLGSLADALSKSRGDGSIEALRAANEQAKALMDQRRFADAEAMLRETLARAKDSPTMIADTQRLLAITARHQKRLAGAIDLATDALSKAQQIQPAAPRLLGNCERELANELEQNDQARAATPHRIQAVSDFIRLPRPLTTSAEVPEADLELARNLTLCGDDVQARQWYSACIKALTIFPADAMSEAIRQAAISGLGQASQTTTRP